MPASSVLLSSTLRVSTEPGSLSAVGATSAHPAYRSRASLYILSTSKGSLFDLPRCHWSPLTLQSVFFPWWFRYPYHRIFENVSNIILFNAPILQIRKWVTFQVLWSVQAEPGQVHVLGARMCPGILLLLLSKLPYHMYCTELFLVLAKPCVANETMNVIHQENCTHSKHLVKMCWLNKVIRVSFALILKRKVSPGIKYS